MSMGEQTALSDYVGCDADETRQNGVARRHSTPN
jgi:hypothetical protein